MRYLFLILITLFSFQTSFACLSASQNRLFPLGICDAGLVAVETDLYRTQERGEDKTDMVAVWGGISYFRVYDKHYKVIQSVVLDTIDFFDDKYYDSVVTLSFKKGMIMTKNLPNFIPAKPLSITFCDYQLKCSKAKLEIDKQNYQAFVKLDSGKKYFLSVLVDSNSIASNYLNYYGGFDYDSENDKAKYLVEGLLINSIRCFHIGDKKLTVVHFGAGQVYPGNKEYSAPFKFDDINKSVFNEPVLHHGHGFDFFIIE